MTEKALLAIVCVNQPGLLTSVARRLFDLGCNLADTTFAALAGTAEFTAICELPQAFARETLAVEMQRLPEIAGGKVTVSAYEAPAGETSARRITHRFEFAGVDRPGLLVRLAGALATCGAEVLRLNSQTASRAGETRHVIRFAVAVAEEATGRCLEAMAETAKELDLDCHIETA